MQFRPRPFMFHEAARWPQPPRRGRPAHVPPPPPPRYHYPHAFHYDFYTYAANAHSHYPRPPYYRTPTGYQQWTDAHKYAHNMNHAAAAQRAAYQEHANVRPAPPTQPPQAHQAATKHMQASRRPSPAHPTRNPEPPMAHQASTLQKKTYEQLADIGHMPTIHPTHNTQVAIYRPEAFHVQSPQALKTPQQTTAHQQMLIAQSATPPDAHQTCNALVSYQRHTPIDTMSSPSPAHQANVAHAMYVAHSNRAIEAANQPKSKTRAVAVSANKPKTNRGAAPKTTPTSKTGKKEKTPKEGPQPQQNTEWNIPTFTASEPKANVLESAHITYQPLTDTFATEHVAYQPNTDMFTKSEIIYQPRTNRIAAKQLVYQPRTDMIATAETFYRPEADMMSTRQTMFQPQEETIRTAEALYQPQADILATRQMNFQYRENVLNTTQRIYQPRADMNTETQNHENVSKTSAYMVHPGAEFQTAGTSPFQNPMDQRNNPDYSAQTQAEGNAILKNLNQSSVNYMDNETQSMFRTDADTGHQQQKLNPKVKAFETRKTAPILRQILSLEHKEEEAQAQGRDLNKIIDESSSQPKQATRRSLRQTRKRKNSNELTNIEESQSLLVHPIHDNTLTESEWLTRLNKLALSRTKTPEQPHKDLPVKRPVGRPRKRQKCSEPLEPPQAAPSTANTPGPPPLSLPLHAPHAIPMDWPLLNSTNNNQVNSNILYNIVLYNLFHQ